MIVMANYRCFFVGTPRALVASEAFDAKKHDTANERVASLIRQRGYQGLDFELWRGSRLARRRVPIERRGWASALGRIALSLALLALFIVGTLH